MNEVIELDDTFAGTHISDVCSKATVLAENKKKPVHFVFNDTHVTVQPGESAETVQSRWETDYEAAAKAYREHPDRIKEAAEREAKAKAEREAVMIDTSKNEKEMREATVPWPKTKEQLQQYVDSLVDRTHDYGTCVYAMSMAAVAAFNYVAGELGVTGFQSGCADMDVIRRTRGIKGPFMLIDAENALYPQYDLRERLDEAMEKWKPWLKEEAEKKLAESHEHTHPNVLAHWKKLAAMEVVPEEVEV